MVHTKYNFKWFEKEDNRKALRASISTVQCASPVYPGRV